MAEYLSALAGALWLGLLTSINPCPLATNIAAISFLGRQVKRPGMVLSGGLLYTVGRSLAYVALGFLLVKIVLESVTVAGWLQRYVNKLLGPVLILVGMFLLDMIRLRFGGILGADWLRRRAERWGLLGAVLLGVIFALSFCPLSAALFFAGLVPLAVKWDSAVMLPFAYGVGTAVPVVLFAALVAFGARSLGSVYDRVQKVDFWARRITGLIFIGVGIYLTLVHVFGVLS